MRAFPALPCILAFAAHGAGAPAAPRVFSVSPFGPSAPLVIHLLGEMRDEVPLMLAPFRAELPVLARRKGRLGGPGPAIYCPPMPAGRYTVALRENAESSCSFEIRGGGWDAEIVGWRDGWTYVFEMLGEPAHKLACASLVREALGDSEVVCLNGGVSSPQSRNGRWILARAKDAIAREDWRDAVLCVSFMTALGSSRGTLRQEVTRHVDERTAMELVPEAERMIRDLFGPLPGPDFVSAAVRGMYHLPLEGIPLGRPVNATDIDLWIQALDFPDWIKTEDGRTCSEVAAPSLNSALALDIDISRLSMEERTRIRKTLETWLDEETRTKGNPRTFSRPPDLGLQPEGASGAPSGWWLGFTMGAAAGVALAVLCYLTARFLKKALSRGR